MNPSRPPRARLVRAAALLGFVVATVVHASDTQWWISDAPADYVGAESRGVVVAPDGALSLGPETVTSLADSLNVVWSIVVTVSPGRACFSLTRPKSSTLAKSYSSPLRQI